MIKTKVASLFKTGFFHIFGSSVVNKIIAFTSSIVLVRILTKAEYGTFTYAWNIYSIILLFSGMGIEAGVLQLSSEHSGNIDYGEKISDYGTRFGIKYNCLLAIALLAVGLFAPLKIAGGRVLLIALCGLPFLQLLFGMVSSFLRAQKRNQEFAKLQVINTALVFLVSAGCAYVFREIGLIIGYYTAYFTSLIIGLYVFDVHLLQKTKQNIGPEKNPLLKISFITMINNGLSQLMYLIDVFVLGIIDPQETILASYKVATMIPSALTFIPLALVTYLYPYFAEHRLDKRWCLKKYKQVFWSLGALNLFISIVLFIAAPLIIRLLFGEQYLDAVPVFKLLAMNYFFSGTFRILSGNLLVTQRKLKFNLFVAIISSSINIIADYFFIQWWGTLGAAYATMMVVFVSSVLSTTYLIYTLRSKIGEEYAE